MPAMEDPDDRRPRELRIHGVGGSPGSRLLGFELATSVKEVGEGIGGSVFIARRDDETIEGYDWGNLTSGSGTQPFWVLLLPFTVLNAAGWMHPPGAGLGRFCRVTIHVLSVLLSATYVFSQALLLVDLVGYQWTRRVVCPQPASCPPHAIITQQWLGVAGGLVLLAASAVALVVIAGRSQRRFEQVAPPQAVRDQPSTARRGGPLEGTLADPDFFWRPKAAQRPLWVHRITLGVAWLAVGGLTLTRMRSSAPLPRLHLEQLLVAVNVPSAVAVGLLWLGWVLVLARRPARGRRWLRAPAGAGPAIAATLAFAPLVAVYSGTFLVAIKRLSDWPKRTGSGVPGLSLGAAVAFVDMWGGVVVAAALLAGLGALLLLRKPHGGTNDIPDRGAPSGRLPDGADRSWRSEIAAKRSTAWLVHQADWAALLVAVGLWLTAVVSFLLRVHVRFHPRPHVFIDLGIKVPANTSGVLYGIGAYVLVLAPLFVYSLVRRAEGNRTFISTIWDVLTFLPRRFAPFAVRCYAERAVPECQGRLVYHIGTFHRPVVVSAHSQGSMIALAAIASLPDDYARNVALVTYGSPITTTFGRFFPEYFGNEALAGVLGKLSDPAPGIRAWRNFYRLTDPIGGPVFEQQTDPDSPGSVPGDTELADPMPPPAVAWPSVPGEAPLEHDRPVWTQIAVHSYYLNEPELKDWVVRLKTAMGNASAVDGERAAAGRGEVRLD